MNRRLNLTSLPDELLMKIMQGGPTTCDGIPNVEVNVRHFFGFKNGVLSRLEFIIDIKKKQSHPAAVKISDDLVTAIRRDVAKRAIKARLVRYNMQRWIEADVMLPKVPEGQLKDLATQAGTRFLEYIATTLEKIGKKYGLHVRDGRVKEGAATFYLCEGGKLAQASRAFHGLKS